MNLEPTLPLMEDTALIAENTDAANAAEVEDAVTASPPPPRTRWAAIIWGLLFAGIAWGGIWMLSSADRRARIPDWFASLDPGTIFAYSLLALGTLALVTGVVGLIRRVQRHATDV